MIFLKKYLKNIYIIFLILIFISGCDKFNNKFNNNFNKNNGVADDIDNSFLSGDDLKPFPVTVGGADILESPSRVICLSPALVEIIYELGYESRIIGRGKYCDYPPAIISEPDVGSSANPDIGAIIALKPQIVITSTPIVLKDIVNLKQHGIEILNIPNPSDLNGFSDIYKALALVFEGIFTGNENGEKAFKPVSKICENAGSVNIGKFIYVTENLAVAGGNTLESAVLSCFGENLAGNLLDYSSDLLSYDFQPDVILLNNKFKYDDLTKNEFYSRLDAVKNNYIVYMDNKFFERPSGRIVDIIKEVLNARQFSEN